MKKRPWHLWPIVLFVGFMYVMGIYDFFMMLSHNEGYYADHSYDQAVVEYFTNYPIYFMVFWIANLLAGVLAPITLTFNPKWAKNLAWISSVAGLILLLLTFTFRNRLSVLGGGVAAFDIFILLMTVSFYFYCRRMANRQV
ncbi:hypothetical protein PA598K_02865 [Paenibacillus sp. 598K]|uniref:hypothetical protein n=1 Tax=Paenibacillus sp. 598K TaxID=1117987 RepID=UPI000FF9E1DD|nr:hypothetical protein [Paenibacillus sp. 598K]GBF74515.1 hypothetical protein PA598K_02865 [Paenibacillus sp. 598K]